ncbi:J domain-containing protein [Arthrobacter sp. ISL-5]|uniref:J domain-containing protein n=1 Tax=Arthrobacter sp. ISL-5 TaxID=2819111 RepID=UPI001BECD830|nr:J domain-containing protein [Arthrobacter sp. ISL-5]MBT2553476.1 J domain-containing protein [Arthrobacter sp. ISL-5]
MSSTPPDHYAVLHVSRSATQREIARAYRSLMRTHHPDLDSGEAVPAELERIMQAFAVLRDPGRRRAYDQETARAAADRDIGHSRTIPVRVIPHKDPTLRATPVRWESGPWA